MNVITYMYEYSIWDKEFYCIFSAWEIIDNGFYLNEHVWTDDKAIISRVIEEIRSTYCEIQIESACRTQIALAFGTFSTGSRVCHPTDARSDLEWFY